jgi:hypothetical protein
MRPVDDPSDLDVIPTHRLPLSCLHLDLKFAVAGEDRVA